jgi:hypothetical protein
MTTFLPCALWLLQVHRMGWVPTAKGDSSDGEEQTQVSCCQHRVLGPTSRGMPSQLAPSSVL